VNEVKTASGSIPGVVSLCTNFDNWRPEPMKKAPHSDTLYEIFRMVPPGYVGYGFELIRGSPTEEVGRGSIVVATSQEQGLFTEENPKFNWTPIGGQNIATKLGSTDGQLVNICAAAPRTKKDDDDIRLQPRTRTDAQAVNKKKKPVIGWTLKNSGSAGYKNDTKKVLDQAFRMDFEKAKSCMTACKNFDEKETLQFKEVFWQRCFLS